MPSVSKNQQQLFGLALSVKRGETPRSEVSDEVKKIVDNMSEKDIEDFAGTKHKGLPDKKEENMKQQNIKLKELLKEATVDIKLRGDMEGFRPLKSRTQRAASEFIINREPIEVDYVGGVFDTHNVSFTIELNNGDNVKYEHTSGGGRRSSENIHFEIGSRTISNPQNVANEVHASDDPIGRALITYRELYKKNT